MSGASTMSDSTDLMAKYGALDERVTGIDRRIDYLSRQTSDGFTQITSNINNLASEFRGAQKTQWPVIFAAAGVAVSVLVALGGALYYPVTSGMSKIEVRQESFITKDEIEGQDRRAAEDRDRIYTMIGKLAETLVPRGEWQERNHARDLEISDLRDRLIRLEGRALQQLQ